MHNPNAMVCVARDSPHHPVTIPIPLPMTQLTPHDQGQSLGVSLCAQPSISSPSPNLTQHLIQCKTRATGTRPHSTPFHPHPILTQSPPTPHPAITPATVTPCLLNPIPATTCCQHHHQKTTTTIIRDRTPMATHRHSHHCQRHTHLGIQLLRPRHRLSLLDPPKGQPQNGVYFEIGNRPPKSCPPVVGVHSFRRLKWTPKVALILRPPIDASLSKFLKDSTCL